MTLFESHTHADPQTMSPWTDCYQHPTALPKAVQTHAVLPGAVWEAEEQPTHDALAAIYNGFPW